MATAIVGNPNLFPTDTILYGSGNGTTIITKGDWVQWSGGVVVGLNTQATPAFRLSGIGVLLDHNPKYDELGRAINNSAIPILTHGVIRVSGGSAASITGAPILDLLFVAILCLAIAALCLRRRPSRWTGSATQLLQP